MDREQLTTTRYPVENGVALIEIRLTTVQQLFNSLDPAPFIAKDLDARAEEYLAGAVDDFPLAAPLRVVVYLPPDQARLAGSDGITDAIHNYFAYKLAAGRRALRDSLREGRISLLIGLAFLAACFALRTLLLQAMPPGTLRDIAVEGLLISGWVAMWRPIQIFLYGWWPQRHRNRVYARLAAIPVEVRTAS